jgi:hypothetical protein
MYARPISRASDGRLQVSGERWQILTGCGMQPRWGRDGHEVYYLGAGWQMMSVAVKEGARGPELATPTELFSAPIMAGANAMQYALAPDGKRFLLVVGNISTARESLSSPEKQNSTACPLQRKSRRLVVPRVVSKLVSANPLRNMVRLGEPGSQFNGRVKWLLSRINGLRGGEVVGNHGF